MPVFTRRQFVSVLFQEDGLCITLVLRLKQNTPEVVRFRVWPAGLLFNTFLSSRNFFMFYTDLLHSSGQALVAFSWKPLIVVVNLIRNSRSPLNFHRVFSRFHDSFCSIIYFCDLVKDFLCQ